MIEKGALLIGAIVLATACRTFQHHGKFCGPNFPARERAAELQAIPPMDDIDVGCKAHDLCYATKGNKAYSCDEALIRHMQGLVLNPPCANIASEISIYFEGLNPARQGVVGTIGITAGKVIALPKTVIGAALHGTNLMADGRARKQLRCCDRRVVPNDPTSPCYPANATPVRLAVMRALTPWYQSEGLYYEAEIPDGIGGFAKRLASVPPEETAIAVVMNDYSDFGTYSALVFTEGGMYYGRKEAHGFLTWAELSRVNLVPLDQNVLAIGDEIEFGIAGWPANLLRAVIVTIVNAARSP